MTGRAWRSDGRALKHKGAYTQGWSVRMDNRQRAYEFGPFFFPWAHFDHKDFLLDMTAWLWLWLWF